MGVGGGVWGVGCLESRWEFVFGFFVGLLDFVSIWSFCFGGSSC